MSKYQRKKPKVFLGSDGRAKEYKGRYSVYLYWNPTMIRTLRELFPTTKNADLAIELGVSERTLVRKARELGVNKDPVWQSEVWEENRKLAHFANRIKPNAGQRILIEVGKPYRFQKGQPKVELSKEAKERASRRRVLITKENKRRKMKGLAPMTEKEKLQMYKLYDV